MRKWNNILARVIIVLFLLHALMGSLMLLGLSTISFLPLSCLLAMAVAVHGIDINAYGGKKWKSKRTLVFKTKCSVLDKKNIRDCDSIITSLSCNGIYNKCEWQIFLKRIYFWTDVITDFICTGNFYPFSCKHKIYADCKRNS